MPFGFRRLIYLLILCLGFQSVFAARISGFSTEVLLNGSRVEFDLTRTVGYRIFTLSHPDRVVIDLKNVTRGIVIPENRLAGTVLKDVRTAHRNKADYRIVLDLKYKVKVRAHLLTLDHSRARLIVSLIDPSHSLSELLVPIKNTSKQIQSKSTQAASQHEKASLLVSATKNQSMSNVPAGSNGKLKGSSLTPIAFKVHQRSPQVVVVIDPGHGGKDPGATGPRGLHEKHIVLRIAKKMYQLVNQQPGFKAYLTRSGDYYLTLRQRLAVARKDKADMFIAVHADAFHRRDARGASVFALSEKGATSEAARWIARRENASELMGGVDLADKSNMLKSVLIDLSQNATVRASLTIGEDIIRSLAKFATLHHNKVEQAAFVVLKSPDIPSLLVETGFISNPYEERRLNSDPYQWKLAKALKSGIVRYFNLHPPRGTWLAEQKEKAAARRYTVRSGDSLGGLALRFHTTVRSIKKLNHLQVASLPVGQVLLMPTTSW